MTPRQYRVFGFIADFIRDEGYSPSFQEIADAFGHKSKSEVSRVVRRLRDEGLITVLPGQSRSIQIVDNTSKLIRAAEQVLDCIVAEHEERGVVVVQAEAIAALDILLSEMRPREARTSHNPLIALPAPPEFQKGEQP